ncbi:hypothetical protein ACWDSF_19885, partial [Nocardia beijingensis]
MRARGMRERERVTRFRHRAEHSRRSFHRAASTSGDHTNPVIIAQRSRFGSTAPPRAVQVPRALHPGAVVQISRGRILTPSFERSETKPVLSAASGVPATPTCAGHSGCGRPPTDSRSGSGRHTDPAPPTLRDQINLTPSFERSETEHPPFAARLASEWPPRPRRSR